MKSILWYLKSRLFVTLLHLSGKIFEQKPFVERSRDITEVLLPTASRLNLWHELKNVLRTVVNPKNKEELVSGIQTFWDTVTAEKCSRYIGHLQKVIPGLLLSNAKAERLIWHETPLTKQIIIMTLVLVYVILNYCKLANQQALNKMSLVMLLWSSDARMEMKNFHTLPLTLSSPPSLANEKGDARNFTCTGKSMFRLN